MLSRLGLSWEAQDGLPWWQHQAYLEGITWDMEREANLAGAEPQEQAEAGSLEDLGISVREV